MKRRC
jgi:hypothetical protein